MNSNPAASTESANPPRNRARTRRPVWLTLLHGVASLKFTVVLLAAGTFMTWVASLEQTRMDIWEVKNRHFYSPVVYIPLETFCVPAWTPENVAQFFSREINGVKIGLPMPSGSLIMLLMLINLLTAHLVRFRITGRGGKLMAGLVVFGLGTLLTAMVVLNGQNSKGFQAEPIFSWEQLWVVIQVSLGAALLSAIMGAISLGKNRKTEKSLLWMFAILLGMLVTFLLVKGESAFIGDSAMRILWQLIQGGVGSVVMLVGCHLIFGRKSGIVLLHLGLALLMFGEFYVTYSAKEQRMTMEEGQTVTHTIDVRDFEMAIISHNEDQTEDIVCIPSRLLKPQRSGFHFGRLFGAQATEDPHVIDDELLPFKVRPIKYLRNSFLEEFRAGLTENPATVGVGLHAIARESNINTGTSAQQSVDIGTIYAELLDKTDNDKSLGVFMLSQQLYRNDRTALDEVNIDGKTYRIGLRFKHHYKPYSIHLLDTEQQNYPGTQIPKSFSSEFNVIYPDLGLNVKKKVWMNNPLRFGNETFYQQHYENPVDGPEISVLQIVRNTGWMIPYICCMMVAVGLLAQFGQTLIKYLRDDPVASRRHVASGIASIFGFWISGRGSDFAADTKNTARKRQSNGRRGDSPRLESESRGTLSARLSLCTVVFVWLFFGYWFYAMSKPRSVERDGMRLDLLGEVPIIYGGRVQPLDSLARNVVKKLTKSGNVSLKQDGEYAASKEKPIRWLADLILTDDDYGEYFVFKIVHPELQQALGLDRRKGHRYTYNEVMAGESVINENYRLASQQRQRDPDQLTNFQQQVLDLGDTISLLRQVIIAFDDPRFDGQSPDPLPEYELLARAEFFERNNLPLLAGPDSSEANWQSLTAGLATNRLWEVSKQHGFTRADELAEFLTRQYVNEQRRPDLIKQMAARFAPEFREQFPELDEGQLRQWIESRLSDSTSDDGSELAGLRQKVDEMIDSLLSVDRDRLFPSFEAQVYSVFRLIEPPDSTQGALLTEGIPYKPELENLRSLRQAYMEKDSHQFNLALSEYVALVHEQPPQDYSKGRLKTESWLNRSTPFFLASAAYLMAFVFSVVGWLGWRENFNRIAFSFVIIAVLIHSAGLIARCYISGRPPVTNLYSSALLIGLGSVLFYLVVERILRIGVGNLMAGCTGFLSLLIAMNLSNDQMDTMSVLRAVLDTQFWLSTHVVIISLGYSATYAAGFLGVAYILGSIFSKTFSANVQKNMIRMIYGITCFSLFFSFVGTVLGGLWADDSWGRFWGWDVKENGALMIVLVNALLLHARWGGIARDRGLAAIAIFGTMVVTWSWFAVNELGVGLHSYGGSDLDPLEIKFWQTKVFWFFLFWGIQSAVIALAVFVPKHLWRSLHSQRS